MDASDKEIEVKLEKNKSKSKPSPTIGLPSVMKIQKKVARFTILTPTIFTVVALLLAWQYGITALDMILLVSMYIVANLGIEFCFHRDLAHGSYKTKSWVTYLFTIFGSMAGQGGVIYWVATHRRHHIHSDTEHDPHSPHVRNIGEGEEKMNTAQGIMHSHIGWMFNDKMTNCSLFAIDLSRDPTMVAINKYYFLILATGIVLPGLVAFAITGEVYAFLTGMLWGGFVRLFLGHHSTWANSSFSHLYGGQPFDTGDLSANNFWCSIPTFGASWQNNHHAFPTSAYLGLEWWQIDIAGYFIRAMNKMGLVWDVKFPSEKRKQDKLVKV